MADIIADNTGAPNIIELGKDLKEDLTILLDFTRYVEQTPIANFTQVIYWEGLQRLINALGL